jgi:hypothetical protein
MIVWIEFVWHARRKVYAEGGGCGKEYWYLEGASTTPLLPPTGGKNMPEADRDGAAAPTAATVVEVCKIWESHLRAVGVCGNCEDCCCTCACARQSLLLLLLLLLLLGGRGVVGCHCAGCHER